MQRYYFFFSSNARLQNKNTNYVTLQLVTLQQIFCIVMRCIDSQHANVYSHERRGANINPDFKYIIVQLLLQQKTILNVFTNFTDFTQYHSTNALLGEIRRSIISILFLPVEKL